MGEIKAIQTYYNGYKFRSRLEARWAVFFDAGGIRWEYEPEGYKSEDGTLYLPDFYLPELDVYVEVKRDTPDGVKDIFEKCEKMLNCGGAIKTLVILSDIPEGCSCDGGIWHYPCIVQRTKGAEYFWWFFHDNYEDNVCVTGQISAAKYENPKEYIEKNHTIRAVSDAELEPEVYNDFLIDWVDFQNYRNKETFNALKRARQARFEHGEKP